jgi:hypothetical protein
LPPINAIGNTVTAYCCDIYGTSATPSRTIACLHVPHVRISNRFFILRAKSKQQSGSTPKNWQQCQIHSLDSAILDIHGLESHSKLQALSSAIPDHECQIHETMNVRFMAWNRIASCSTSSTNKMRGDPLQILNQHLRALKIANTEKDVTRATQKGAHAGPGGCGALQFPSCGRSACADSR